MKTLNLLTLILAIVGGLNWGLEGIADFDLVAALFGEGSMLARVGTPVDPVDWLWMLRVPSGLSKLSGLTEKVRPSRTSGARPLNSSKLNLNPARSSLSSAASSPS